MTATDIAPFTMTIDGAEASARGSTSTTVINPATEDVVAMVPDCSAAMLDRAMETAARAQPPFEALGEERRQLLIDVAGVVESNADELAAINTLEQGKPFASAQREVLSGVRWLRHFATLATPVEVIQDDAAAYAAIVRKPVGVVAAITPWNFPLGLPIWKIAPALLAGNTMVLKPSPFAPLSALRLGEMLRGVVPNGVLNVVSGGNELGAAMVRHRIPRKITMTGSTEAGRRIAAAAGEDLKRVTLELGGNDAAIVLDDADPSVVAERILMIAFFNAGQACTAVKRVYVHDTLYDDVLEQLVAAAQQYVVGAGDEPGVTMGPVSTAPQVAKVERLLAEALASGARAVCGGRRMPGPGYFVEPTILADAVDGMGIVDDEQFGPVLPVIRFRDIDEAIRRANGTQFGLGGSVWSSNVARAAGVAKQLDCGIAWVNAHSVQGPHLPFGGMKWSGLGVENGLEGLREFTSAQLVHEPARV